MEQQRAQGSEDSIQQDLTCRTCEYSLVGLAPQGRCPECGTPIQDSLRSPAPSRAYRLLRVMFFTFAVWTVFVGGIACWFRPMTSNRMNLLRVWLDPVCETAALTGVSSVLCSLAMFVVFRRADPLVWLGSIASAIVGTFGWQLAVSAE